MRLIISLIFVSAIIFSCKPSEIIFTKDTITNDYINSMVKAAKGYTDVGDKLNVEANPIDLEISDKKIFRAFLTTTLVVRDGVVEETITNAIVESHEEGLPIIGNHYVLYVIVTKNNSSNDMGLAILLPTILNADSVCIGIGPAWIGRWGAGDIELYKQIKWHSRKLKWIYDEKFNDYKKTNSIYSKDLKRTKNEITVVVNPGRKLFDMEYFRILEIYNRSENKFGGMKPMKFDMSEIFGDSNALYFEKQ